MDGTSLRRTRFEREKSELEFSRIVAFSDGVFAIAITLLVLGLQIPRGVSDLPNTLHNQLPDFFAFALSFAVLARTWLFHHRFFAALGMFDGSLITLNFLYLALVTLVPFTSGVIGDYGHQTAAAILYASNIAGLGMVGAVMVEYAFRREFVKTDIAALFSLDRGPGNWLVAAVFLASIPISLISVTAAEYSWLLLFVFGGFAVRRLKIRQASP